MNLKHQLKIILWHVLLNFTVVKGESQFVSELQILFLIDKYSLSVSDRQFLIDMLSSLIHFT